MKIKSLHFKERFKSINVEYFPLTDLIRVKAGNDQRGFGKWCFDVVYYQAQTRDVIICRM
ncbi:MAG: hypothetical protein OQK29_00355 [Ignavibacteriaceae bacterium]|nr:hypothetical protein [Ignavibacteriaceae bacterium]